MLVLFFLVLFYGGVVQTHGVEQFHKLVASAGSVQQLGNSVDVSIDGKFAVIGAPTYQGKGGALLFDVQNKQSVRYLVGSNSTNLANQGYSVSITDIGYKVVVGGPTDGTTGSIWIWSATADRFTDAGGWVEVTKLVPEDAVGEARFGESLDTTASIRPTSLSYFVGVVGGPMDDNGAGAFWVIMQDSSDDWSLYDRTKLIGTGAVGKARQGSSVAISGDSRTIAVGGWADDDNRGATWIFRYDQSLDPDDPYTNWDWHQQGEKLVYPGLSDQAMQGSAVSLSEDGKVLAVGAKEDGPNKRGAVCIFTRVGEVWTPAQKLVATDGTLFQGHSVSFSMDAGRMVMGAAGNFGGNATLGSAWFFDRNAQGVYTQQTNKLIGSGNTGLPSQGRSISISNNGLVFLVGGPDNAAKDGAVWIYTVQSASGLARNGWMNAASGMVLVVMFLFS